MVAAGPSPEPLPNINEPGTSMTEDRQDQLLRDYQQRLVLSDQHDDTTMSSDTPPLSRQASVQDSGTSALPPLAKPSSQKHRKGRKKKAATTSVQQQDMSGRISAISPGQSVDSGAGDRQKRRHRSESQTKLIASEEEADEVSTTSISRQQSSALNTMTRSLKVRVDSRDMSRVHQVVAPVSQTHTGSLWSCRQSCLFKIILHIILIIFAINKKFYFYDVIKL